MSEADVTQDESPDYTDPTTSEVPSHQRDAIFTLLVLLVAGILFALSGQFAGIRISVYDPGAAFWGRAIMIIIFIAGAVNLLNVYRRAKADGEVNKLTSKPVDFSDGIGLDDGTKRFIAAIILFTIYLIIIEPLGFLVATPPFLIANAWMLGYRGKPVKLVFFSLLTTFVFFVLFVSMNIALPSGTGAFREIAIFVENTFGFSI